MHRRQRHAKPVVRDPRANRQPRRSHDDVIDGALFDIAIHRSDRRNDGPVRDDGESLARVPEVRIGNRLARAFDSAEWKKPESLRFDQLLKEWIGDEGRPVTAGSKREAEGDHRMDVTGASDSRQQNVHAKSYLGERGGLSL